MLCTVLCTISYLHGMGIKKFSSPMQQPSRSGPMKLSAAHLTELDARRRARGVRNTRAGAPQNVRRAEFLRVSGAARATRNFVLERAQSLRDGLTRSTDRREQSSHKAHDHGENDTSHQQARR